MRTHITQRAAALVLAVFFCVQALYPMQAFATAGSIPSTTVSDSSSGSAPDSSQVESVPASSSVPESTPDSVPATSGSASGSASSSAPAESESASTGGSTSANNSTSQSAPDSVPSASGSASTSESTPAASEPQESQIDEPLSIKAFTDSVTSRVGKKATLSVTLNRTDAAAIYQWQRLVAPAGADPAAQLDGGETADESAYYLPVAGMTEAQLLALNPDAIWPGKEMWDAAVAAANGDTSVHFENGTPIVLSQAVPVWEDIADATEASYTFTVTEADANTLYRCAVSTSNLPKKEKHTTETPTGSSGSATAVNSVPSSSSMAGSASSSDSTSVDSTPEKTLPERTLSTGEPVEAPPQQEPATVLLSEEMRVVLEQPQFFSLFGRSASNPNVTLQDGWLVGIARDMEYITADAYTQHSADAVDNPYWTKLAGGTRADGTTYIAQSISLKDGQYRMPLLSAWYGKTVYVRRAGHSGKGMTIDIPAYTDTDFTTGKKVLYKKVLSVLSVRVPETGVDFYSTYIDGVTHPTTRELMDGKGTALVYATAPLTPNNGQYPVCFNTNPERYLQDAEGNYRFDSVMLGVNVLAEPDLSGKAAWALKNYMAEGYGIMTGHDMMYGYGGVISPDYIPDPNSTATPYYELNTNNNGHWNMNWLMGANKLYTEASPYEAASMVLCSGSWIDKSTLYGDNYGNSTIRVNTFLPGNADADVSLRSPTNYPYNTIKDVNHQDIPIAQDTKFETCATHSNQQLAYGTVWLDFASNSLLDSGCGQLITDTRASLGLTGTNNFYLTTNGNLALNQIGHRVTGQAAMYAELQLFANTILYISQRQQCQICQSEQGGNKEVHFVHRISSVEELERLKDQSKYWYTAPTDGCYILTADIVLPPDWSPIENFYGHFHANGYGVTLGANGAPLFANTTGTLGQYTGSAQRGWNLGTEKEKGINAVTNTATQRATGMARVSGFLGTLFSEDNTAWANKIVTVEGTDGVTYSCKTNADGKYVLSNLPCPGIMKAHVYDTGDIAAISAANEVTRYGPICVNVPAYFWDTDETTVLYLLGFTPLPLENKTVYEGQQAAYLEGGIYNQTKVESIQWQYREKGAKNWRNIEESNLDYTLGVPDFIASGDDSRTMVSLTLHSAKLQWSQLHFRAVFTAGGKTAATDDASYAGHEGLLTVLPRPAYLEQAENQSVWVDCNAQFTASIEYWKNPDMGLQVAWEYSKNAGWTWESVSGLSRTNVVTTAQDNPDTDRARLAPYKTTTTLAVGGCLVEYNEYGDMLFRAVYSYDNGDTKTIWHSTAANRPGREARLKVKAPDIAATDPSFQVLSVNKSTGGGVYYSAEDSAVSVPFAPDNIAVYTSTITYSPGLVDAMGGTVGSPTVAWQFKDTTAGVYRPWDAAQTAKWAAYGTGFSATQTVSKPAPIKGADNQYQVTATLTLKNCPSAMDAGPTHFYFRVNASTTFVNSAEGAYLSHKADVNSAGYAYDPDLGTGKMATGADLNLQYSIDIHHLEPVITQNGSYADWTYPALDVTAPNGAAHAIVRFTSANRHASDTMYPVSGSLNAALAQYPNIKASGDGKMYAFTSVTGQKLAEEYWQGFLRLIVWRTYDLQANGGVNVLWYIDEDPFQNSAFSSASGNFYQFVPSWNIHWDSARAQANSRSLYGQPGYLASITSAAEQDIVAKVCGSQYAWLGGCRLSQWSDTWVWNGGTADPDYWKSFYGAGTGGAYQHWDAVSYDNFGGKEDRAMMLAGGYWNDFPSDNSVSVGWGGIRGFIVEYNGISETFTRTQKTALDTDNIYTGAGGNFTAFISAKHKIYDGTETNATVTLATGSGLTVPDLAEIVKYATVSYSSGKTTGAKLDGSTPGSGCIHAGDYTATITFPGLPAKYVLAVRDSTLTCKFHIAPRGLAVFSRDNDKTYDGTADGIVKNARFAPCDAVEKTGVVAGDTVALTTQAFAAQYPDIHQTNGTQVPMTRTGTLALTNDPKGNYYIMSEEYTGAIAPKPLFLHSRYLEDPAKPKNIRAYNGTDVASISQIIMDGIVGDDPVDLSPATVAGVYADKNAQETLTEAGCAQAGRFFKLGECEMTRTGELTLINNPQGDYAIGSESYSGAIYRKTLEANVPGYSSVYGEDPTYKFETLPTYSKDEMGNSGALHLAQLAAGDTLVIDEAKSGFVYPATGTPDKTSGAGFYEVGYDGLTQDNYSVLKNYIVTVLPGGVIVTPRTLTLTVDGGYIREQGRKNPPFAVRYEGFVNGDTEKTALTGKLAFETSCKKDSPPFFMPDGKTLRGYPVFADGLMCRENAQGLHNYELEWKPGDIKVYALALEVKKSVDRETAHVGETVTYTLTVKNTSSIPVKNIKVYDESSGTADIKAYSTQAYRYLGGGRFLVFALAKGESVEIRYSYTVRQGDAGTTIRNVAFAEIPGDPFDPVKPFDPGAPQNPDHVYPSEEVRVQVPQLTGFITLRVPASSVTVHDTDTGKLLSYTLKPFPKTGISVSKTGDTLIKEEQFSLPLGQSPVYAMPERVKHDGLTWLLDVVSIVRADGLRGDESETVLLTDPQRPEVAPTYTVHNGARTYTLYLAETTFTQEKAKKVDIEYKNLRAKPQAPTTYVQEKDGAQTEFKLESIEPLAAPSWRKVEIPATYYGDEGYRFYAGTAEIPYSLQKPVFAGYESELLALVKATPKQYRIKDAYWTDADFLTDANGARYRRGIYVAEVYAGDWVAHYTTGEDTITATAVYTANGSKEQIDYVAMGTYAQQSLWQRLTTWQKVLLATLVGVLLVVIGAVIILFIVAKKRNQKEKIA